MQKSLEHHSADVRINAGVMLEFFLLLGFVILVTLGFTRPPGKRAPLLIVSLVWLLLSIFATSMMLLKVSSKSTANVIDTKPINTTITPKHQPASLRILVKPQDSTITITGPLGYYRKIVGSARFGNLIPGEYKVIVSKPNYISVEKSYSLIAGSNETREIMIKTRSQIEAEQKAIQMAKERDLICSGVQLIIEKWSWRRSSDMFVEAQGLVTNVSGMPLESVVARVNFYTSNDEFITSEDALIAYRPLLVGQSSPFKVIETFNPAMAKASLELAEFWGTTYKVLDRKTWNRYKCDSR